MAATWLKRAAKSRAGDAETARKVDAEMIATIEAGEEKAVRDYVRRLDAWDGPIVVEPEEIARVVASVPAEVRQDIDAAVDNVRRFALAQRDSVRDFAIEVSPGVTSGQRMVPVACVGAYVPTGRYAHIASAYMGIATAKAAKVGTSSPPPRPIAAG